MKVLSGRVAIVTGGSRGIGRAIAVALANNGAAVAINYHSHEDEAMAASADVRRVGTATAAVQADVSRAVDVARLLATVHEQIGTVDILVNNAGVGPVRAIDELTEPDWIQTADVNLKSAFLMTQAVVPDMRVRKWGRIINLSSAAAFLGGIIGPHYAASKAGLIGLTHGYASRLAKDGITVNTIAPALINTDMIAATPNVPVDAIPVGRLGTVEEVADVAVLLATNAYITGQTIHVNGGMYMT